METEIGQQAPQVQQLSEENKQKVMLIKDINSVFKLLSKGQNLSTELFDMLYDAPVKDLEETFATYRHQYACKSIVI